MRYKVTILLEVEANSYQEALEEGESILKAADNLLTDDELVYEVITAEEVENGN